MPEPACDHLGMVSETAESSRRSGARRQFGVVLPGWRAFLLDPATVLRQA